MDRTYIPPPEASEETIDFLEACQYEDNVQSEMNFRPITGRNYSGHANDTGIKVVRGNYVV